MDCAYSLINSKKIITECCSSPSFEHVLHEYLTTLNNELQLLVDYKTKAQSTMLTFDHLCVIEKVRTSLPTPYISNIYRLNLTTMTVNGKHDICHITPTYPFSELLESIRSNYQKVLTGTPVSTVTTVTAPPKRIARPVTIKPSPIVPTKRVIPLMPSSSDSDSDSDPNSDSSEEVVTFKDLMSFQNKSKAGTYNSDDDDAELLDAAELEKELLKLQKQKKAEEDRLAQIKGNLNSDLNNYSKFFTVLSQDRQTVRIEKDKMEQKRRTFDADRNVYYAMKKEIESGKRDPSNIPDMNNMDKKFTIFSFMDDKGLLDDVDSNYVTFNVLYDDCYSDNKECADTKKDDSYVPHNYHYLSSEQQEQYKKIKDVHKDDFYDFVQASKKPKKEYPSFDSVMKALESEDDVVDDNIDNFDA